MEPVSNAKRLIHIRGYWNSTAPMDENLPYMAMKHAAQHDINFLLSEIDRLQSIQQERDKLIEGLREMVHSGDEWYVSTVSMQKYAARMLGDIGVGRKGYDNLFNKSWIR